MTTQKKKCGRPSKFGGADPYILNVPIHPRVKKRLDEKRGMIPIAVYARDIIYRSLGESPP